MRTRATRAIRTCAVPGAQAARSAQAGRQKAAGFTLLEVLIAVVIVSVGLLGVASMQLNTLKTADGSKYRSVALTLAADMADRMRANLTGSLGGMTPGGSAPTALATGVGYNRPRTTRADPEYNTPKPTCRAGGCTPGDMALDDLAAWQRRIGESLPGGIGVVCIDSGSMGTPPTFNGTTLVNACDNQGSTFAIKILWLDNRDAHSGDASSTTAYGAFVTRVAPMF